MIDIIIAAILLILVVVAIVFKSKHKGCCNCDGCNKDCIHKKTDDDRSI